MIFVIKEGKLHTSAFRRRYIASASFKLDNSIISWFNNIPFHGAPLALDLVMNSILKEEVGSDYNIKIINHPLPYKISTKMQQLESGGSKGFQIAFTIGFSMALVSSLYIMFYVREKSRKAKHLQFVAGVKVIIFWGTAYLNDVTTFLITILAIIITLVCFQEDGFKTFDDMSRVFFVLIYFGWAVLPLTYVASFCFTSGTSGFTRMSLVNIFTGVATFVVVEVIDSEGLGLQDIAEKLHWVFLIVPHYALSTGMNKMYTKYAMHEICSIFVENCTALRLPRSDCLKRVCEQQKSCCNTNLNYYEWEDPGIGRNLFFSMIVGAICIGVLMLIEFRILLYIKHKLKKRYIPPKPEGEVYEDFDVFLETQRIRNASDEELRSNRVALRDATKYFNKFLAVNNLCLTVGGFECFGLLGVNGAGKTTTFKMMTGDISMTYGDAWVNGVHIKENIKEVHKYTGYCPQFDALLEDLTGRETLRMFCLLKGITFKESKQAAVRLSQEFDFYQHLDKKVREYSGGNKRKLSTAVALIGDPAVIYLDEPSTGMDPATKRHLWNVLCSVRDQGKCLILTSHSMEECEALCTRLAIMVNGSFKCIGSIQHLKDKFSQGYSLNVKIRKTAVTPEQLQSQINDVKDFVTKTFPGATLREEYQELLCFTIKSKALPWSEMFGIMERGKSSLNIEDYSIGQSNLEQVFLTFTRVQKE